MIIIYLPVLYLYQQNFDPNSSASNLVIYKDDSEGNSQFQLTAYLQSNINYIVVFITYSQLITGNYSLTASGLVRVNLQKVNDPLMTSISIFFYDQNTT